MLLQMKRNAKVVIFKSERGDFRIQNFYKGKNHYFKMLSFSRRYNPKCYAPTNSVKIDEAKTDGTKK